MPNITGTVAGAKEFRISTATGCFTMQNRGQSGWGNTQGSNYHGFNLDASLSSPIYGNSDTVTPASVNVTCVIYLGK